MAGKESGKMFGDAIWEGIEACRGGGVVVLFITPSYLETEWPLLEMGMAHWFKSSLRILPLVVTSSPSIEFVFLLFLCCLLWLWLWLWL